MHFSLFLFYLQPCAGLPLNAARLIVLHNKSGQPNGHSIVSTLFAVDPVFLEQHNDSLFSIITENLSKSLLDFSIPWILL